MAPLTPLSQLSDKHFEAKIYAGSGFAAPGSFKGNLSRPLSSDSTFFKINDRSMGLGFRYGAGLGYILREFLVLGVDVEYLKGKELTQTAKQQSSTFLLNGTTTISYGIFSIMPNVRFQTAGDGRFDFYNRLALIVGIPTNMKETHSSVSIIKNTDYEESTTYDYDAVYTLGTGLGYQAAIGFMMNITQNVRGFLEVDGYGLTLKREKYEELHAEKVLAKGPPGQTIVQDPDHSRNIILYKEEGVNRPTTTGSDDAKVTTYTHPQDPLHCNAITVNLGLVFAW